MYSLFVNCNHFYWTDIVNITRMRHERMLGLRYCAMLGTLLPCRGRIVFHDTSFVSILISDTDLIICNQAGGSRWNL